MRVKEEFQTNVSDETATYYNGSMLALIFCSYQVRAAHCHDSYVHWMKPSTNQMA